MAEVAQAGSVVGLGLINVSAASLRGEPSHTAELETQAIYGTPVLVIGERDGWLYVETPDGYKAYAHPTAVELKSEDEMIKWRSVSRLIVTSFQPTVIVSDTLATGPRYVVSDATLCCIFEGQLKAGSSFATVVLPDGRKGYIPASSVDDFDTWMKRPFSADDVLDAAYSMMGVPYLWGGSTPKAIDCSGLTQLSYFYNGILLPRNASQQAVAGKDVDMGCPEKLNRADLLFFGDGDGEKITHVGVYDGSTRFVHASGRVFLSSFDPFDSLYIPRRVLKAVRIYPLVSGGRAVRVADHPWYFNVTENIR